jgi:hypothetical protein
MLSSPQLGLLGAADGAKMGQVMRHFMPIYANAYAYAASFKGAQVPVLRGFGAFSRCYSSTIGVCRDTAFPAAAINWVMHPMRSA